MLNVMSWPFHTLVYCFNVELFLFLISGSLWHNFTYWIICP